jgi:hypothetical protein
VNQRWPTPRCNRRWITRLRESQHRALLLRIRLQAPDPIGCDFVLKLAVYVPNDADGRASPHIERFNRTLREEALNHFIFLDAKHVLRVCREYVEFYNRARPSQALHAIPEPYPELITPPRRSGDLIALPVLGGVQHDYRLAA